MEFETDLILSILLTYVLSYLIIHFVMCRYSQGQSTGVIKYSEKLVS